MSENDRDLLAERLEALSRRIDARVSEFETQGVFSDSDSAAFEELRQRHDSLRQKLDTAAYEGSIWSLLRTELQLDIDSLIDEFAQWKDKLDARIGRP